VLFSDPVFVFLFFPLLFGVYQLTPRRGRNTLLLLASLFFFIWGEKEFVLVLLGSITANYFFGLWIDRLRARGVTERGLWWAAAAAVTFNLGLLFVFKYLPWVWTSLNDIFVAAGAEGPMPFGAPPRIHQPLGISFFTFQAMSYVLDVARGHERAQRSWADLALYVSLFPQLIAGPIIRYGDIARQLTERTVGLVDLGEGARRFIIGLAKKVVIANVLGIPADTAFALADDERTMPVAWLGLICYTLQLYFDFSGYSDMAIGLGRMFGFRIAENFAHPYIAQSLTEFWRRWHLSLSSWFRDYLYLPLGGNRCSPARNLFNLCTVFVLCGFWHGASWDFIAWGAWQSMQLVIERLGLLAIIARWPRPFRHVYMLFFMVFSFVWLRADGIAAATEYQKTMFGLTEIRLPRESLALLITPHVGLTLIAAVILCMPVHGAILAWRERLGAPLAALPDGTLPASRRWLARAYDFSELVLLGLLFWATAAALAADTYSPFLYFRF